MLVKFVLLRFCSGFFCRLKSRSLAKCFYRAALSLFGCRLILPGLSFRFLICNLLMLCISVISYGNGVSRVEKKNQLPSTTCRLVAQINKRSQGTRRETLSSGIQAINRGGKQQHLTTQLLLT